LGRDPLRRGYEKTRRLKSLTLILIYSIIIYKYEQLWWGGKAVFYYNDSTERSRATHHRRNEQYLVMPRIYVPRTVRAYQDLACNRLKVMFGENNVKKEWDVAKDSQDDYTRELYSPRLDIAVGPFNINRDLYVNNDDIDESIRTHRNFLKRLWHDSELRIGSFNDFIRGKNKNPRCLLATEIENSGSSKHMLGNIANVSIIGSIGIVVPFNSVKLSLCKRIKKYVTFATKVNKISNVFKNILIIDKEKFLQNIR